MSELDQILARSKQPGAFVERRRFTLAREKAMDKLRSFALRHPRQYVLELVQCAVFAGASWIAVDVDHERLVLAWVGGKRLHEPELAGIFDYLFASRGRSEHRHLVQLAIGVNAILSRRARSVRIESGDGTTAGTLRVDLDKRGRGHVGRPERPMDGTYVLAEFGRDWLARFSGETLTEEEALVEERCRYTPVPILLNGRAPFGYKPSRSIRMYGTGEYEVFESGHRRGYLRAPVPGVPSEGLQMVVGGVRVCTLELPQLGRVSDALGIRQPMVGPGSLSGVICDDRLRKTADQADIVHDQRFIDMLAAVQEPATRLIRRVQAQPYEAPVLPPPEVAEVDEEGEIRVLPLGSRIAQVPPRVPLRLEQIAQMETDEPLFWVRRQDELQIAAAVAPHRFPHPVLVLEPGQVLAFEERFPHRALARLSNAGDVDFVRRALERSARRRQVEVSLGAGVDMELSLRIAGAPVRYLPPDTHSVPVTLCREDGLERLRAVPVELTGVSARLTLAPDQPFPADADLRRWLLEHAWRLLPHEAPAGEAREPARQLLVDLLAVEARPHFVRDGATTRLEVGLPLAWGGLRRSVWHWPLATTDSGPLTLEAWLSAIDSGAVLRGLTMEALAGLHRLEQRLGIGHLATAPLHTPLVAVARIAGEWRPWTLEMGPVQERLWIDGTLAPQPPPGRQLTRCPVPGVGRVGEGGEIDEGLSVLQQSVLARLARLAGEQARAAGPGPEREVARLRLAALQLGAGGGRSAELPVFLEGGELRSLRNLQPRPIRPRGGVRTPGIASLALSLEELRLLEADSGPLALVLDDAPTVWESLAQPGQPGWVLRQQVGAPALRGWLGLRHPYDETARILVRGDGTAVLDLQEAFEVHGVLEVEGELSTQQIELVRLARHQLLTMLAEEVVAGLGQSERDQSLRLYAMRLVLCAPESVLGRRLAPLLWVHAAHGRRWGTLATWLETPRSQRPPLPVEPPGAGAAREEAASSPERVWAQRLQAALDDQLGHWALEVTRAAPDPDGMAVRSRAWQGTTLRLELNSGHGEVAKALDGVPRAVERLLLEMARQICTFARSQRLEVDLGTVQRVLIAQRLS